MILYHKLSCAYCSPLLDLGLSNCTSLGFILGFSHLAPASHLVQVVTPDAVSITNSFFNSSCYNNSKGFVYFISLIKHKLGRQYYVFLAQIVYSLYLRLYLPILTKRVQDLTKKFYERNRRFTEI